ncbi:hypothetical protein ANCCAN_28772 [Ancylostoma caninum]|uniref:Peptidase A2 domain-containing protein n=1 Tax=Ancylostoma caninum TaxID=29170 RepID=A0A368F3M6_ANCCA|nr:hypothetical protein ANCCAN_28772 [Ancylostoma caninum]
MDRQPSSRSNPHSTNRNRVRFNTQRSEGTSRFRRPYVEHELQNGTRNDGISANMSVPKESIPTNNLERHQVVLMTAEGNIWNHKEQKFQKALFFFDTGAQKTIIREQLADELGLPQQHSELCVMSRIGGHIEQFRSNFMPLKLSTTYGKLIDLTIQTKPVLTNGFSLVNLSDCDKDFLEENGICLSNTRVRGEHQIPEILVGQDYYYALVLDNGVKGKLPSGLHIINTVFGPTVQGRGTLRPTTENPTSISMGLTLVSKGKESEILQNIFELDGLGISSDES